MIPLDLARKKVLLFYTLFWVHQRTASYHTHTHTHTLESGLFLRAVIFLLCKDVGQYINLYLCFRTRGTNYVSFFA